MSGHTLDLLAALEEMVNCATAPAAVMHKAVAAIAKAGGDVSAAKPEAAAYAMGADRRKSSEPAAKPKAPERTVRVRIAVAVDDDGDWQAFGGSGYADHKLSEYVKARVGQQHSMHWVEAELPVPQVRTVRGEVTP